MTPDDIDPHSGCRLPLPKREDLDDAGKRIYDQATDPKGGTIRGLKGPAGIQLHSPALAALVRPVNRYLRYESGLGGRVRELAILVTARECASRFEWAAHEPEALKEGLSQAIIDVVKYRKPATGLDGKDAIIIELGRELFRTKQLGSSTYAHALTQFGARGLVDIVELMGNYAGTALLLAAFDMQLDPGTTALLPVP
ncbi:MAG: carboxymuconolactone decarboxylase family protein [Stellaceae bacterium]